MTVFFKRGQTQQDGLTKIRNVCNEAKRKLTLFAILFVIIVTGGCREAEISKDEDKLTSCNDLQSENVIEIKDLHLKLYFESPNPIVGPHPASSGLPEGIIYARLNNVAWFYNKAQNDETIFCVICNLPDYAINWNQKNQNVEKVRDLLIEDKYDVIVSGKIHVYDKSNKSIL
jgi:hypothetical protein